MTLLEMSAQYADRAAVLRDRITVLRGQARQETDMRTVRALRSRIAALLPLWQEAKELAQLTAHYYAKRRRTNESDQS